MVLIIFRTNPFDHFYWIIVMGAIYEKIVSHRCSLGFYVKIYKLAHASQKGKIPDAIMDIFNLS